MLDLSHQALFTFSHSHPCDHDHPVVMDQVFGAQLAHASNRKKMNSLGHRIKKLTSRVHSASGFKLVKIDFTKVDKLTKLLTHELFDVFSWNRVRTPLQASWKEYFHGLYEILVQDFDGDHACNVIVARSLVQYHDVLKVPEHVPHADPMYPVIASLSHLFAELKAEHVSMHASLKTMDETLRRSQAQNTEVQHVLVALKKEYAELSDDNAKYMHIMRWSAQ
jgi:hypothetical protein